MGILKKQRSYMYVKPIAASSTKDLERRKGRKGDKY